LRALAARLALIDRALTSRDPLLEPTRHLVVARRRSSRILFFTSFLLIISLEYLDDSAQIRSDVEECLNDQRDVLVRNHPIRVAEGRRRKMAVSD
ncbi:MAG: hypothetical protein ACRDQT_04435, partial [Gaiellaceae bacterium]